MARGAWPPQRRRRLSVGQHHDHLSGGRVTVRPIGAGYHDELTPCTYQSEASWYGSQQFRFLVFGGTGYGGVNAAGATATWGPPAHTYSVGTYKVLVWPTPITVGRGS
jgi:hypothetical protein